MPLIFDDGLCLELVNNFIPSTEREDLLTQLLKYPFEEVSFKFGGLSYVPKRQMCAFGDENAPEYKFSQIRLKQNIWTPLLLTLKEKVEKQAHHELNSAVLNLYPDGEAKISKHKDNENCLDPQAPVCAISLGAARTIIFSRPGFVSRKIKLESGSLLIMRAQTNSQWHHQIDKEMDLESARISITFRKTVLQVPLHHVQLKRKRSSEEVSVENDSAFHISAADIFNGKEEYCKIPLGEDTFLCLTRWKENVIIHIRKFFKKSDGILLPGREGISFTPNAWYEFILKFSSFHFYDKASSFICNNELAVLNCRDEVLFHSIREQPKQFKLTCEQFLELGNINAEFTDEMCKCIISRLLPLLIEKTATQVENGFGCPDDIVFAILLKCFENEVIRLSSSYLKCVGCELDHPSQFRHTCMTLTAKEKFEELGKKILLMINCNQIASELCEKVSKFNPSFFERTITVENIVDNLFVEYVDNPFETL